MSNQEYLVSVNVPPILEEGVVDCLLAIEPEIGFSSTAVNAHTSNHEHLSLAEQVAGRQTQIHFQMYILENQLTGLTKALKHNFSGSGIRYWVTPVIESGEI